MERVAGQAPDGSWCLAVSWTLEKPRPRSARYTRTGACTCAWWTSRSRCRRTTLWRHRSDRPKFRHASRLAAVGVLSRVVDALNRVSLLFRGKVAKGTEAAAETIYRANMRYRAPPVLRPRRAWRADTSPCSTGSSTRSTTGAGRIYGVNDHEADWEQVVVYLAEQIQGSPHFRRGLVSAHDRQGDDLRRRWDDPDLITRRATIPWCSPGWARTAAPTWQGDYLTSF